MRSFNSSLSSLVFYKTDDLQAKSKSFANVNNHMTEITVQALEQLIIHRSGGDTGHQLASSTVLEVLFFIALQSFFVHGVMR